MAKAGEIMSKKRNGETELTPKQIEHLWHGFCLAVDDSYAVYHPEKPWFPFRDQEHRRSLWFQNKEYLLSLRGRGRILGVFPGRGFGLKDIPQAQKDYETKKRKTK